MFVLNIVSLCSSKQIPVDIVDLKSRNPGVLLACLYATSQTAQLQREAHRQSQSKLHHLDMRNAQLLGSIEALEKQLQQQVWKQILFFEYSTI